ncbi:hypothetical protein HHX25_20425 [Flavivirga sp. Y03]|uniref:Uncharacterized protein n=2 Tax=Flavivirga algicola TaxID=2729136 RepID=A0ABX1S498_9FLAO|nr:hypothetical protein [Flavivirga algicola]
MKIFLILISFLLLINSNVMHQDTPLQIDLNGNIIGLPKEFSPAKFGLNEKKLRINDKEIVFPKCLNYYFEEHKNPKINFLASWYHSKEIMPYYLIFNIHDNDVNYGYKILVDLETLDLIYVNKFIREGNTTYNPKVELDEKCLTDYKNAIKILK